MLGPSPRERAVARGLSREEGRWTRFGGLGGVLFGGRGRARKEVVGVEGARPRAATWPAKMPGCRAGRRPRRQDEGRASERVPRAAQACDTTCSVSCGRGTSSERGQALACLGRRCLKAGWAWPHFLPKKARRRGSIRVARLREAAADRLPDGPLPRNALSVAAKIVDAIQARRQTDAEKIPRDQADDVVQVLEPGARRNVGRTGKLADEPVHREVNRSPEHRKPTAVLDSQTRQRRERRNQTGSARRFPFLCPPTRTESFAQAVSGLPSGPDDWPSVSHAPQVLHDHRQERTCRVPDSLADEPGEAIAKKSSDAMNPKDEEDSSTLAGEVRGIQRLRSGDVAARSISADAVGRIVNSDTSKRPMEEMGPEGLTEVRRRTFRVVAEFVPTSFEPSLADECHVAGEAAWTKATAWTLRGVKAIERRDEDQKVARAHRPEQPGGKPPRQERDSRWHEKGICPRALHRTPSLLALSEIRRSHGRRPPRCRREVCRTRRRTQDQRLPRHRLLSPLLRRLPQKRTSNVGREMRSSQGPCEEDRRGEPRPVVQILPYFLRPILMGVQK